MPFTRHFRSRFFILLSLTMIGVWALILLRLTPHPDLLHQATKTRFSGEASYQWLSGHELLILDRSPYHSWNISRLDMQTGAKSSLPELQRSLSNISNLPYALKASPDGKLLVNYGSPMPQLFTLTGTRLPSIHTQSIHTQRESESPELAEYNPFWLTDGRLVFLPSFNDVLAQDSSKFLYLPVIDTRHSDSSLIPHPSSLTLPRPPELYADTYYSLPSLTGSGLLYAYAPAYEESDTRTLLTLPLKPDAVAAKYVVHAPPGMTFEIYRFECGETVQVSPQSNRVFWLCHSHTYTPPLLALLHRILPRIKAPLLQWMSLQVSNLDGSNMREIGGVSIEINPSAVTQADIPCEDKLQDARWLPDGEHISFCYHQALYTVGVTP